MKTLLLISVVLLSTSIRANDSILHDLDYLPALSEIKITVSEAPQFAAVQPTGHVEFKYTSCSRKNFKIDKERKENVLFVKVIPFDHGDCKGPSQTRDYKIQVTSDFYQDRNIVVLNPLRSNSQIHSKL